MSSLNIVFIIGSLGAGGAEKQLILLAEGLLREGHSVKVITLSRGYGAGFEKHIVDLNDLVRNPLSSPKEKIFKKIIEVCLFAPGLYRYLKNQRPQIVHAWLLHSYVIGIPIASLAGVPVRISARRGLWSGIRGKKWLIFSKLSNLFATHFTANSESVSRDVMRFESLPNDKVSIIPNIIQRDDRRANVKLQPARVVVVANLIEYKGHLDLLEAISLTNPKLLFEFVGQGPMLEVLLRRSSDLGINERVKFLGYHPNPIEVMLGAQFGVLPSHSEGLPNAILEAQSVGLPMIATRVGGIPEILHHNWNGLIVNPRSPVELAEAISFMSENPIERNRFSSRSIESLDSYSSKNIVNLYLELYQNLIHSKN